MCAQDPINILHMAGFYSMQLFYTNRIHNMPKISFAYIQDLILHFAYALCHCHIDLTHGHDLITSILYFFQLNVHLY